jgi:hypothetical protein
MKELKALLGAQKQFGALHEKEDGPVKDALLNFIHRAIETLPKS